jgi:hypothetical protein
MTMLPVILRVTGPAPAAMKHISAAAMECNDVTHLEKCNSNCYRCKWSAIWLRNVAKNTGGSAWRSELFL